MSEEGGSHCEAYTCESGRLKLGSSWLKDDESCDRDAELSDIVQLVQEQSEICENNRTITLRKDEGKRCEIVLSPVSNDLMLEWTSITIHSSSRIIEIYTDDRKNYICTAKYQSRVAPNQYICAYSSPQKQPITCRNLCLKFLSLDHPSTDRQGKINMHNVFLVGTVKRRPPQQETNQNSAMASMLGFSGDMSDAITNDLMSNPTALLMSLMGGLQLPPSPIPHHHHPPPSHNPTDLNSVTSELKRPPFAPPLQNDALVMNPSQRSIQLDKCSIQTQQPTLTSSSEPPASAAFIQACIQDFVRSDEMKKIVHQHVDERMSYWEKRILSQLQTGTSNTFQSSTPSE